MDVLKSICFAYVHFIMKCGLILGCYTFNCKRMFILQVDVISVECNAIGGCSSGIYAHE
jgi:hypothetical protein